MHGFWSKVYGKRYQWGPGVAALMVPALGLLLYAPRAVEPRAEAQTTAAPAELARPVIQASDFVYQGAFTLPQYANGWSTSWGVSGITCRRVGGQLRFITGSHMYSGDAPYEVAYPGVSKTYGAWPTAKITNEWSFEQFYGDKKLIKEGTEYGITSSFHYEPANKRLYFNFGSWYNVPPTNEKCVGYVTLEPTLTTFGAWNAPEAKAHCQRIRGGALSIPAWFATAFTGGRRLGLGFGGYYSGFAQCSKGPFLTAAFHPGATAKTLNVLNLIDYPDDHWGTRNCDYNSEISWSPNPVGDVGFWGAKDEIYGGATWIDLADKHGVLFVTTLGHGRVWYEVGDRYADEVKPWWWVYDPKALAEVAQGTRKPWDHTPKSWQVTYTPRDGKGMGPMETPGCCFDKATRTLFVLAPMSYYDGGSEIWPLVHAWKVK